MPKLIYFPLYIDKWIAGTQELTFEERGFYISLLVWLYDSGKPIKDADHAARILRCDKRTSRRLLAKLRPKFRLTSAGLRHRVCDELLRNGGKIRGLQGNNSPANTDTDTDTDTEELDLSSLTLSSSSTSGDSTEGRGSKRDRVRNAHFPLFWSSYPIKREKKRAEGVWKRKNLDKHSEMIIADVERRKLHDEQWARGYIPHASTYLNGDRWEDELSAPQQARKKSNLERLKEQMPDFFGNDTANEDFIDGEVLKKEVH